MLALGGKRIRPLFVLMACELFNEKTDDAVSSALAVELFHNFTLVHDDIMDNAPLRRNKPTVHSKWNNSTAIFKRQKWFFQEVFHFGSIRHSARHITFGEWRKMNYF